MYSTASFTVVIFSASSSGTSMPKASSNAITNSTWSSESAPRSSTNDAVGVTSASSTPSCSTIICFTRSSTLAIRVLRDVQSVYVLFGPLSQAKEPALLARSTAARNSCVRARILGFAAPCRGYEPVCLEITPPDNLPILVRAPRKVNFAARPRDTDLKLPVGMVQHSQTQVLSLEHSIQWPSLGRELGQRLQLCRGSRDCSTREDYLVLLPSTTTLRP